MVTTIEQNILQIRNKTYNDNNLTNRDRHVRHYGEYRMTE